MLAWTDGGMDKATTIIYASPFGERKKMSKTCLKLLKNVKTIILQGHFSARNMI